MARILIGTLSGWKHHDRRRRCLSTWMADGDAMGVRSVFLLGSPTAVAPEVVGPHALVLPCPDDYPSLPQRTRWFCQWALSGERCQGRGERGSKCSAPLLPSLSPDTSHLSPLPTWDYLFKCDDDTYISIPRLLDFCDKELEGRDYVGAEWRRGVRYGSGGAGYLLSRKAAELVALRLDQACGAEDLLVGGILRAAGMELTIEPRLVPFGSIEHRPRRDNDLITLHGAATEAFLAAHADTGLGASRDRKATT